MDITEIVTLIGTGDYDVCAVFAASAVGSCGWMARQWVKERDRSARLTKSLLQVSANAVSVIERVSLRG